MNLSDQNAYFISQNPVKKSKLYVTTLQKSPNKCGG